MTKAVKDLRDWLFRALTFEGDEADKFRRDGIQVGADTSDADLALLREAIASFDFVGPSESTADGPLLRHALLL